MADDWQVGDLALCVKASTWSEHLRGYAPETFPKCGCVYAVKSVLNYDGRQWLGLDEIETGGWLASRFRKIRPHTPDAEDAETIRLLNGERVKEGVQ